MYSFDLLAEGAKHSIVGVRTDADKAQYIKFVQDMDEDAKADHDKLIKEDLPDQNYSTVSKHGDKFHKAVKKASCIVMQIMSKLQKCIVKRLKCRLSKKHEKLA